ncbi:unnamed protein product [Mytilus coruscus]|uniref:Reverse transcriptase RNase H-like domain-containing protein n=1 Tax=Mytilus coruscus TaxID=42192 RepID=A0A6J8ALI8_MYTCO|nr:unnamed protein product [Mytilus coruscus]
MSAQINREGSRIPVDRGLSRCVSDIEIQAPRGANTVTSRFFETFYTRYGRKSVCNGAVLSQEIDGKETVIAYGSRTLSKTERKYCVTRKELLAVVNFVKHFRHFLYGRTFVVRTDHSSLQWLMNFKNAEGQLARWLEVLSSYNMKIKHRPGNQHRNADALSRMPCKQCGFNKDWEKKLVRVNVVTQAPPIEANEAVICINDGSG